MLTNKDLISDRPATMKDVTEVAQAVLESIGTVVMETIDLALSGALPDPAQREAAHSTLLEFLPVMRNFYREDESIFSAVLANAFYTSLRDIRVRDAEAEDDDA